MNVISMMNKIHLVANPMIGESALPHLALSTDDSAEFMRICALNQLNGPLDGYVNRGSQQEMHMLRHQNKRMEFIPPLAAVTIKSLQEDSDVRFNHEQSATVRRNKGDEISSRRGDKPRRPQSKPQRLKAASVSELKLARVELVPFPVIFCASIFVLGKKRAECWDAERTRMHRSRREGHEFIRAAEGKSRFQASAAGVALALCMLLFFSCRLCVAQEKPTSAAPPSSSQDKELEQMWDEAKRDSPGWARSVLESQEKLTKFGYGTTFTAKLDDKTKEALRAYQRHSSLTITGDLDFATWTQMQHDNAALTPDIPLGPVYMFNDSDWENAFTVEGVWLEQGKDPDDRTPLRPARIECFKANRTCITATRGETLIHFQYLDVERWDKYEIATRPDDLPCGREYIHISRPEKSVLTINTAVYQNKDACTKLFGPPGQPSVSRLADAGKLREARVKAFRAASDRIVVIPAEAKSLLGAQNH
jgi:hypothetical protein